MWLNEQTPTSEYYLNPWKLIYHCQMYIYQEKHVILQKISIFYAKTDAESGFLILFFFF